MADTTLFGVPPGADFPKALRDGVIARYGAAGPEALARVQIFVNTGRMQRRLRSLFAEGGALLLPRIRLIQDLGKGLTDAPLPPAISPLRRRLELAQLIARLIEGAPDLAPTASAYDLADSLATLLDEMHGEGVTPEEIAQLDVTDQSGHWARALEFIRIVQAFVADEDAPDAEARQRMVVERLAAQWAEAPPPDPILIAGSTGSRGATHLLMEAVARLPQGAVILPGFDFDLPEPVWESLSDAMKSEDHPQFRYGKLLKTLGLSPSAVGEWAKAPAPCPPRNTLLSLALRPAPVTDQWMSEGAHLEGIAEATAQITYLKAPSARAEALAIALRMRQAVDTGETLALITPDRMLTRQVTAALDRWQVTVDDSAGFPLHLSAPGRFLRLVARLYGQRLTIEALLTLLKHPITHSAGDRGTHLLRTRELELSLRRNGPAFPDAASLRKWATKQAEKDEGAPVWAEWLIAALPFEDVPVTRPLADWAALHIACAEALAAGPTGGESELWREAAGRKARAVVDALTADAGFGGDMAPHEYSELFRALLAKSDVRAPDEDFPNLMILGTQEARVQAADVVILGGLNDGIWPPTPAPDPWLNRKMRHDAGLLLPERRIGLSAHDFQMAAGAKEIWLSRAARDSEAETVPSRWLNRLVNLLSGLEAQGGAEALAGMEARGDHWLALAAKLEQPGQVQAAKRPSPRPPVAARPVQYSVTQIKTLIRDPYAIYARGVLGLKPVDPLHPSPDAPLRGTVLHSVLERFIAEDDLSDGAEARLIATASAVLEEEVPWPTARRLWLAKLARVADWFVTSERARRETAAPIGVEKSGKALIGSTGVTLTARLDRVDSSDAGTLRLYDYKTGAPPSKKQQAAFDKQLLLEAAMIEHGAFPEIHVGTVDYAAYIGLGASPKEEPAPLDEISPARTWAELDELIRAYLSPNQGFTARRAPALLTYAGDYDHLSRYGEWEDSDAPTPEDLA
ncbi:double-strand break repair protein AddB [Pseudoruegeria sp. SHC-113]|uniref:double-strand break repair protein AddB n=1 Tax=Pseudoruegeria sp. SHC-113 TaxID=2855439 RepID=UPI0021BB1E31|nr:double-strand break repair protein AddB [Pseudoruegeria sp. SHC-113]MCT8158597.1 double-strand break repair protein AddB [Pseudoruegeria sp. SHC-113]